MFGVVIRFSFYCEAFWWSNPLHFIVIHIKISWIFHKFSFGIYFIDLKKIITSLSIDCLSFFLLLHFQFFNRLIEKIFTLIIEHLSYWLFLHIKYKKKFGNFLSVLSMKIYFIYMNVYLAQHARCYHINRANTNTGIQWKKFSCRLFIVFSAPYNIIIVHILYVNIELNWNKQENLMREKLVSTACAINTQINVVVVYVEETVDCW